MGPSPHERGDKTVSLPLDLHPAVRDEIAEAYEWYEQRRPVVPVSVWNLLP